jgi:hypothetical protein
MFYPASMLAVFICTHHIKEGAAIIAMTNLEGPIFSPTLRAIVIDKIYTRLV